MTSRKSITDQAQEDAKNGVYDPPIGNGYQVKLYESVWNKVTQQVKGLN